MPTTRLCAAVFLLAALSLSSYAQAPLSNNMPANGVLGQATLITNAVGATASGMNNAFGIAVDPTTGKLFVADRNNSRVLRFTSAAKLINGSAAEAALGQPDLVTVTANTGGISAATMNTPIRLFVDASGRLWVSDYGNRRILRFDSASVKVTGAPANGVLGQPDFVTNTAGTTAAKMNRTTGVFVDAGGRLWVGERDNNRVLRFDNAAAKANGANADGVLGEPDFVTATGGLSATLMNAPFGVYVDDAGRLWVCEDGNNRALRFDNAATLANGAAANGVLGQPNFTSNSAVTPTRNGATNIRGVYGDGQGRIYLVEESNHRITVFNNAAGLANGANASFVLGQADFTSALAPAPPTASSFNFPNSMFVDRATNQIWVADAGNNRVLRFDVSDVTFHVQMPASGVLGQSNLTSNTAGATASTMNNAFGIAVDPTTGKLFVADRNNSRVLRFSSAAKLITGAAAEAALGQPDLVTVTANTGGISAATMNTPIRLFVDAAGRLWVSDYGNRRVLRFDSASVKVTGAPANGVLGQPDFVTNTAGTTAAKMNRTTGVFVDAGGRLWVGERDNSRVLRFDNAAAKANGANADGVLGEPDFVTATGGLSATLMNAPFGVFVDAAGSLWVCEDGNNRVLRFDNAAALANGAAANGVLGQPNFTSNSAPTPTQNGTTNIRGVFGDGSGGLYVVEEGNHRILYFANAASLPNGANASNVLGQADFTSALAPATPTAGSFNFPNSMFIDNAANQIWVADAGNNRVLRFDMNAGPLTGISTIPDQRPTAYALSQNFPNPFNPTTSIRFRLPESGNVRLEVFDVLGRLVAVLVNEHMQAGSYQVPFNASALSSGVYLYRLSAKGYSSVQKMMLLK